MIEALITAAVTIGLAVTGGVMRWMFAVHSKLATIATALTNLTERIGRISEYTIKHSSTLDRHDERIKALETRMEKDA